MGKRDVQANVPEAKTQLSKLLAKVERGDEVIIARDGRPVAKLVPFPGARTRRLRLDDWKGRIWMAPDFDAPMPDEELETWVRA